MTCPKCNASVAPGAAFCASCGTSMTGMGGNPMPQPMPMQGGYGYNPYGQGMMPMMAPPRTSGLAIAGFVLSLVFCGLLGLIFSVMGKNEIQRSGGTVVGSGFATAGIVISIIRLVIEVIYIVVVIAAVSSHSSHF